MHSVLAQIWDSHYLGREVFYEMIKDRLVNLIISKSSSGIVQLTSMATKGIYITSIIIPKMEDREHL